MNIGIIGFGLRAQGILRLIVKEKLDVKVVSVCDVKEEKQVMDDLKKITADISGVSFYHNEDDMLDKEKLDGVLLATRCSLHAKMAIKVLKKDIPLYLEKPVGTTLHDLDTLQKECKGKEHLIVVSFPLKTSKLARFSRELIEQGKVGKISQIQAWNNVPYGGVYYHSWYRDDKETGGLFLQKATHDFDCINYLIGEKPVDICAMSSKVIFKGEKRAGLKCVDCEDNTTCEESPYFLENKADENVMGEYCCFAVDTGNQDSGSVIIRYESGVHACYTQNFVARKKAAGRGVRVIGYHGTLEFDWYTNEIKVFSHQTGANETYQFNAKNQSHFGGDLVLVENFMNIMKKKESSISTIEEGIKSARMCLAAVRSDENREFVKI